MSFFKHDAIRKAHSEVMTIRGEEAFDINDNPVVLDETKVAKELEKFETDYNSKQYQRDRQYPSIGEQLDQIYWDKKNGTKNWEETIDAVKAEHPKP